jgi:condensin complex subunit 2
VLPQIDEETGAIIGSIDPQNQSLVSAPKQVEKILIGYAKQAKKMDMRKLKVIEWNTLQHLSEKANQEDKENKDDNGMEKETSDKEVEDSSKRMKNDSVVNFTELYQKLYDPKIRVPTRMLENLSVPLAFVALLHLCNENNLALENVPDFSNFKIQQG